MSKATNVGSQISQVLRNSENSDQSRLSTYTMLQLFSRASLFQSTMQWPWNPSALNLWKKNLSAVIIVATARLIVEAFYVHVTLKGIAGVEVDGDAGWSALDLRLSLHSVIDRNGTDCVSHHNDCRAAQHMSEEHFQRRALEAMTSASRSSAFI